MRSGSAGASPTGNWSWGPPGCGSGALLLCTYCNATSFFVYWNGVNLRPPLSWSKDDSTFQIFIGRWFPSETHLPWIFAAFCVLPWFLLSLLRIHQMSFLDSCLVGKPLERDGWFKLRYLSVFIVIYRWRQEEYLQSRWYWDIYRKNVWFVHRSFQANLLLCL